MENVHPPGSSEDLDAYERRQELMGEAVRAARGHLSQTEFGVLVSVPQPSVSRWERGEVDLTYEQVYRIEMAVGLPLGSLAPQAGYAHGSEEDADRSGWTSGRDQAGWAGRVTYVSSASQAARHLRMGHHLGLGVMVRNRQVPAVEGPSGEEQRPEVWWAVTLLPAPPQGHPVSGDAVRSAAVPPVVESGGGE